VDAVSSLNHAMISPFFFLKSLGYRRISRNYSLEYDIFQKNSSPLLIQLILFHLTKQKIPIIELQKNKEKTEDNHLKLSWFED